MYSLADDVDKWDEERIALWIEEEEKRQEMIAEKSGISDPVGKRLAVSASQYITERASTGGKSIMAGFPYFADWGGYDDFAAGARWQLGSMRSVRAFFGLLWHIQKKD